jgi:hypothetical protein
MLAWALTYAACAIALSWIAIINGFPLVFSDTGTYLRVGTELYLPNDRPPYYGLLILPIYKSVGLWGVVITQALIICWILDETILIATGERTPGRLMATVSALAIGSGISWFSGRIMPDVFTGLAPLTIFVILFGGDHWRHRWLAPAMLVITSMIHLSHMPLALGTVLAMTPIAMATRGLCHGMRRAMLALGAPLLAIVIAATANMAVGRGFHPLPQSSRFLFGRLLDAGLAQPVIRQACATRPMMLCDLGDYTGPDAGQRYLWRPASPLPAMARANPQQLEADEAAIVWQTLSSRPAEVLGEVTSSWGRQLLAIDPADGVNPWPNSMQITRQIDRNFSAQADAYHQSLQQRDMIDSLAGASGTLRLAILPLIPFLFWALARKGLGTVAALGMTAMIGVALNALICSALSGVFDRYQSRIEWLIAFWAIVAILALGSGRRSEARAA